MEKKVCVVGAGLVGAMLATRLAQRGMQVDVYERRPDLRKANIKAGRSINLALSDRGIRALEMVGASQRMRELSIPMHGRFLHDMDGHTSIMPYGREGQYINSISRGMLNAHLLDMADQTGGVNLHFNSPCADVDLDTATIRVQDPANAHWVERSYEAIFGTDGAFSVARAKMLRTDRFNYSQQYISSGYKELSMPPRPGGGWALDKNHLHIWPRKQFMLIALPNLDGSFTCTLFLPFEGEESFEQLMTDGQVLAFFGKYFGDAKEKMDNLLHEWHANAASSLVTVKTNPWHYKDKVLLLGDAAHAIVPFYGQGMNAGFEDVRILDELMGSCHNWGELFASYSQQRVADGQAIADLAVNNYTEMRDLVADPHFVKKRALSVRIGELMPQRWVPLYSMVTFSHMPYSEALRLGEKQGHILEALVNEGIDSNSEPSDITKALTRYL